MKGGLLVPVLNFPTSASQGSRTPPAVWLRAQISLWVVAPCKEPLSLSLSSSCWQGGSLGKSSSAGAWAPGAHYRPEVFNIWMSIIFTAVNQKPVRLEENFRTSWCFFSGFFIELDETKNIAMHRAPRIERCSAAHLPAPSSQGTLAWRFS